MIRRCPIFIKSDKSDQMFFDEFRDESRSLQDVIKEGEERYFAFPSIAQDIFTLMFENSPPAISGPLPMGLRIAKQNFDKIQELREYQELKRLCNLDAFASGLATQAMGKEFIKLLPRVSEDPEKLKQEKAAAEELGFTNAANQIQEKIDGIEQYLAKVDPYTQDDDACRQKVRGMLQNALQETRDTLEGMDGFGCGDEPGQMKQQGLKEKMELARRFRDSAKLKEIAKLAGRFIRIAKKKNKEKMVSITVSGIETGDTLSRILPAELGKLANPMLVGLFFKNYSEKQLLQYRLFNKQTLTQGPIVFCVDTSGSTEGSREISEKALAMSMCEIAKIEKRSFVLINYSGEGQFHTFVAENGKYEPLAFMVELEMAYFGGTSWSTALGEAIKQIELSVFNKADIIFLSDDDCEIEEEFLNRFLAVKKSKEFSCIGISVGCSDKNMKAFCDETFSVSDLIEDKNNAEVHERIFKL